MLLDCNFVIRILVVLTVTSCFFTHSYTQSSPNSEVLHYTIYEEEPAKHFVANVKVDAKLNSLEHSDKFVYSLRYQTGNYLLFTIDASDGVIRTKQTIDRESVCLHTHPCTMELDITISPVEYFQIVKVSVTVKDKNDHPPVFPQSKVLRSISEEIVPGITFPLPHAEDPDSGINTVQGYNMAPTSSKFGLRITDNADGTKDISLEIREKLDREETSKYSFMITAYDGGTPSRKGTMALEITVTDANDNNPVFDQPEYTKSVKENIPLNTTVITVHATDPDYGNNGKVFYSFSPHTQNQYGKIFGINRTSGEIIVKGEINYETDNIYHLTVEAKDMGPDSIAALCKVVITVIDVNDHAPAISINTLTDTGIAEVRENVDPGAFVFHAFVTDPDHGGVANIKCSLDDRSKALFELHKLSEAIQFKVVTKTRFDRESQPFHLVTINCTDLGLSSLYTVKNITVRVLDANDHAPLFPDDRYFASVDENKQYGSVVANVVASDADEGINAEIMYSIKGVRTADSNLLKIESKTGQVTTNTKFDYEKRKNYQYLITATDHGRPVKASTTLLDVSINDMNDQSPQFLRNFYNFSIKENREIGTLVGQVNATDNDTTPFNVVSYFIDTSSKQHSYFSIKSSGKILTARQIDREEMSECQIIVVAHNEGYANTVTKVPINIIVEDENDNQPLIHFPNPNNKSVTISGQTPVGHEIAVINATDPDSGLNGRLFYRALNGNSNGMFAIDNSSGVITVAKSLTQINHKTFTLIIAVNDSSEHNPHEMRADLSIVVDKNVAFKPSTGHSNLTNIDDIMLPLGIVVGIIILLMVIILTALIVKYRRRRVEKEHKYNCRLEANKTLINGPQVTPQVEKTYHHPPSCERDPRFNDDMMIKPDNDPKDSRHGGMMIDFHQDHCPMKVHGSTHHHPFMETELDRQAKVISDLF